MASMSNSLATKDFKATRPEWIFDGSEIEDTFGYGERAVDFLRRLKHPKSESGDFELPLFWERIVRRIYGPCYAHRNVIRLTRHCRCCGFEYETRSKRSMYCSTSCLLRQRRGVLPVRTSPFVPVYALTTSIFDGWFRRAA